MTKLFTFDVTAPANTAKADAAEAALKLKAGIVTRWSILIPDGHCCLAHLAIRHGETQIIPWGDDQSIKGNAETLTWEDDYELAGEPVELTAVAWNDDDTYPHTFYLRVWISGAKEVLAMSALNRLVQGLLRLLGRLGIR